jgi:hypothetical protein
MVGGSIADRSAGHPGPRAWKSVNDRFWPDADKPISANYVRLPGRSGLEMLAVSLSEFEPNAGMRVVVYPARNSKWLTRAKLMSIWK